MPSIERRHEEHVGDRVVGGEVLVVEPGTGSGPGTSWPGSVKRPVDAPIVCSTRAPGGPGTPARRPARHRHLHDTRGAAEVGPALEQELDREQALDDALRVVQRSTPSSTVPVGELLHQGGDLRVGAGSSRRRRQVRGVDRDRGGGRPHRSTVRHDEVPAAHRDAVGGEEPTARLDEVPPVPLDVERHDVGPEQAPEEVGPPRQPDVQVGGGPRDVEEEADALVREALADELGTSIRW
jgi:hypothetical protein